MNVMLNTKLAIGPFEVPVAVAKGTDDPAQFERATTDGFPIKRVELHSVTGEPVTDTIHGTSAAGGFRRIPPRDIAEMEERVKVEGLQVHEFSPLNAVDWTRVCGLYYLLPQQNGIGARPLRLLRDTLKRKRLAAVGKVALMKNQYAFALRERGGALVLNTLTPVNLLRDPGEAARALDGAATPSRRQRELFAKLVEPMEEAEALGAIRDSLTDERLDLITLATSQSPALPAALAPADFGAELERQLEESIARASK